MALEGSGQRFELRAYVGKVEDRLPVRHELNQRVNDRLKAAGITVAFPSWTCMCAMCRRLRHRRASRPRPRDTERPGLSRIQPPDRSFRAVAAPRRFGRAIPMARLGDRHGHRHSKDIKTSRNSEFPQSLLKNGGSSL
ncbi:hypothetical protein [Delftia tsuruhatensis]|uniref:hypothetical protein n=1 Tax=Delftia tsuruhatensis TaxID=180282 RepID=UPI002DD45083|nr:hypothetical protein [Delftia tsuruhatensis]